MRAILTICLMLVCSGSYGRNALQEINYRRTHAGLPAFRSDPALQAAAERSARNQANRGRMSHNSHIGDHSGVGMTSDRRGPRVFRTCYAFQRGSAWAGAAAVQGRNGNWYFALDLRNSPSNRSNRACPRCGKTHR